MLPTLHATHQYQRPASSASANAALGLGYLCRSVAARDLELANQCLNGLLMLGVSDRCVMAPGHLTHPINTPWTKCPAGSPT